MAGDRDVVLLETVRTHRSRLVAAFLFGELDERRVVIGNVRRMIVGLVLAAVACAGCAGTAFVLSVLANQQAAAVAPASPSTGTAPSVAPGTVAPATPSAAPAPAGSPDSTGSTVAR